MKKVYNKSFGLFVIALSVVVTGFSQQNLVPQPLPCLLINSQDASSLNGLYTNQRCIEVGGEATETSINVYGNNQINLKAGKEIHIAPNTHIKPYGNGSVHAYIASDPVEVVWFEPNSTPGFVGKFNRLELGFRLPTAINQQVNNFITNGAGGVNPFDPDQIDFRVHLTAPDGSTLTRFAFYYKPYNENLSGSSANPATIQNDFVQDTTSYPWRFRFAPPNEGLWKISIEILITQNGTTQTINESGITFVCVPSTHQGTLKVSHQTGNGDNNKDRWMYYSVTNAPFFAISENLANADSGEGHYVPSVNRRHLAGLQKLIDAGGNFTRFELGGQNALPDWDVYNNYNTKMDEMYAFDRMINKCEDNDIYFTLFRHHVEVNNRPDWATVKWQNNPYKLAFNIGIDLYFSDAEVLEWQNKCLRYIFSRWGYSPNMTFYSYSEVDSWYSKLWIDSDQNPNIPDGGAWSECTSAFKVRTWIYNQQEYIKSNLSNSILFCHSPAKVSDCENQPISSFFGLSDVVGIHSYEEVKNVNFTNRYEAIKTVWNDFKKPIIIEEMGTNLPAMLCCTGIEFHNALWSTAMMGDFGAGMDWWWDRGTFDNDYQVELSLLKTFFQDENLREGNFEPQKWSDDINQSTRLIENFSLVQGNKERVLGWVHNATFYWRNLSESGNCIQNLVDNNYMLNSNCHVALDPYGIPVTYNPWESYYPRPFHEMYDPAVEKLIDYFYGTNSNNHYRDHWTNIGGATSLQTGSSFKIKNLKNSGVIKKEWYLITYYSVHGNSLNEINSETIHTTLLGSTYPLIPNNMGHQDNADYAYKVSYLGNYKKMEIIDDTTVIFEANMTNHLLKKEFGSFVISPNPNNGNFSINSSEIIQNITIYDEKGENVFTISNMNSTNYDVKTYLSSGTYLVQVQLENKKIINKKIVVL